MATWRWDFEALKMLGTDENGWPILQVDKVSYDFTGKNITTNDWKAKKDAGAHFADQGYTKLRALGYERIDKPASYGYVEDPIDSQYAYFRLQLSEQQQARLKVLQQEIWSKVHSLGTNQIRLPYIEPGITSVMRVAGGVLMLLDTVRAFEAGQGYHSHEVALQMIAALQRFYTHITPDELSILNIRPEDVSQNQIFAIRRYEATRQPQS